MNTRSNTPTLRSIRRLFAATCLSLGLTGAAHAQGIPTIPAFLPTTAAVPAGAAMPIDGEWTIAALGKRIRIEAGRAYAVDPWLHAFVLQIQPGMVVIQNLQRTAPGRYSGDDLPLMGRFDAQMDTTTGVLNVTVASVLGTIRYQLLPSSLDDQARFDAERRGEDVASGDGEANDWDTEEIPSVDTGDEFAEYEEQ